MMASRKAQNQYTGFARRLDIISFTEAAQLEKRQQLIKNPFKVGDRVESLDTYGKPLKCGVVTQFVQSRYGSWCIYVKLDESNFISCYYYPRGLRHEQKALAVVELQCTAITVYKSPANNITRLYATITQAQETEAA